MFEQLDVLEGSRNPEAGDPVGRLIGQYDLSRRAHIADASGGRGVYAADQVEYSRLSSAIGPDQREHLALMNIEADVIDGQHAPKSDAEVFCGQDDSGGIGSVIGHFKRSDF